MPNGIGTALQRQKDRPDIHKAFQKPKGSTGYGQDVIDMVRDLKEHVPTLSTRQLSTIVGIGAKQVRNALANSVPEERWTPEDNEGSAAAELAVLRMHHDRYQDDVAKVLWDGKRPDADEWCYVPVFLPPRHVADVYRRADQSHSNKRPITLATTPYSVAA